MSWVSWQEPDKNRGGKISRWIYCHQFQKHRHTYQFNQRDTSVNLHHLQRMKEWCLPAWYRSSVWLSSSGSYSIHELHPTDQTEIFHTKTLHPYHLLHFGVFYPTWSHKIRTSVHFLCNNVLCTFTAHFATFSKINVHRVALKRRLNTWILAHFYYVDIDTYCCGFIMLLQKRIAAVQNSISVPKS